MHPSSTRPTDSPLNPRLALLWCVVGAVAFQLAWSVSHCGFLIALYLWSVFELSCCASARQASYFGLLLGMLSAAPQLSFFWRIFGPGAIALWTVWAFWLRMFIMLARSCRIRCRPLSAALLIPFFWMGFEYFRSELYYLRFSWLGPGIAFSGNQSILPLWRIGVYGTGFSLMALICATSLLQPQRRLPALAALLLSLGALTNLTALTPRPTARAGEVSLPLAGVQIEFPSELEILANLNALIKLHPEARLLVLSEYSVDGPVPARIKSWCREHERYLVIGGKDAAPNSNYYNTAFVVGPSGEVIFRQAKSVPIQFLKDGLPAASQALWESPWGKIGFCVCYDLSYTRVTDRLVRMGAQAIIVPTMDVEDWGRHEHDLHSLIAPVRAAEYSVPVFRLASSGISQCVDARGVVRASAPMPGDAAVISGNLELPTAGHLPYDRCLAPISVFVTAGYVCWLVLLGLKHRFSRVAELSQRPLPISRQSTPAAP